MTSLDQDIMLLTGYMMFTMMTTMNFMAILLFYLCNDNNFSLRYQNTIFDLKR